MRKKQTVVIYQEGNRPITLIDEDERSKVEYAKALSEFMHLTNISILETSNSAVIIRPSKINAFHVIEEEIPEIKPQEKPIRKKVNRKPIKKKEEIVDIITDVD